MRIELLEAQISKSFSALFLESEMSRMQNTGLFLNEGFEKISPQSRHSFSFASEQKKFK
jgi:hypothetical protein